MKTHPANLNAMVQNYLGKSCYDGDAYLKNALYADFSIYDTVGNPGIAGVMGNDNGSTVTCRFDSSDDFDPPFSWKGKLRYPTDVLQYQSGSKIVRLGHNGVWLTFHKQ